MQQILHHIYIIDIATGNVTTSSSTYYGIVNGMCIDSTNTTIHFTVYNNQNNSEYYQYSIQNDTIYDLGYWYNFGAISIDPTNTYLYGVGRDWNGTYHVTRVTISNGNTADLYTLILPSNSVYWTTIKGNYLYIQSVANQSPTPPFIYRYNIPGNFAVPIYSTSGTINSPTGLAINSSGTTIYYGSLFGTLEKVEIS